jgi:hypothetical protein
MAKDKQQKKKDREKRVAKEKLEAAAKRRQQETTPAETPKTPAKTFGITPGGSKVKAQGAFTQRRSGGG